MNISKANLHNINLHIVSSWRGKREGGRGRGWGERNAANNKFNQFELNCSSCKSPSDWLRIGNKWAPIVNCLKWSDLKIQIWRQFSNGLRLTLIRSLLNELVVFFSNLFSFGTYRRFDFDKRHELRSKVVNNRLTGSQSKLIEGILEDSFAILSISDRQSSLVEATKPIARLVNRGLLNLELNRINLRQATDPERILVPPHRSPEWTVYPRFKDLVIS